MTFVPFATGTWSRARLANTAAGLGKRLRGGNAQPGGCHYHGEPTVVYMSRRAFYRQYRYQPVRITRCDGVSVLDSSGRNGPSAIQLE